MPVSFIRHLKQLPLPLHRGAPQPFAPWCIPCTLPPVRLHWLWSQQTRARASADASSLWILLWMGFPQLQAGREGANGSTSTMTFSRLSRFFSLKSFLAAGTLSVPLFPSVNELDWLAPLLLQFLQATVTQALPPHTFLIPKQCLPFSLSWPFPCPPSAVFYR